MTRQGLVFSHRSRRVLASASCRLRYSIFTEYFQACPVIRSSSRRAHCRSMRSVRSYSQSTAWPRSSSNNTAVPLLDPPCARVSRWRCSVRFPAPLMPTRGKSRIEMRVMRRPAFCSGNNIAISSPLLLRHRTYK